MFFRRKVKPVKVKIPGGKVVTVFRPDLMDRGFACFDKHGLDVYLAEILVARNIASEEEFNYARDMVMYGYIDFGTGLCLKGDAVVVGARRWDGEKFTVSGIECDEIVDVNDIDTEMLLPWLMYDVNKIFHGEFLSSDDNDLYICARLGNVLVVKLRFNRHIGYGLAVIDEYQRIKYFQCCGHVYVDKLDVDERGRVQRYTNILEFFVDAKFSW